MIDAKDFLPYRVIGASTDYLFAFTSANGNSSLYRLTDIDAPLPPPVYVWVGLTPQWIWACDVDPATLLAVVNNHVYKSTTSGSAWGNNAPSFDNGQPLFRVGHVGTPAVDSSVLQRGVCWDGDNVYLCEYNINTDRVNGGLNDAVKIIKSVDRGTTWTVAAIWNTDGNHYVRHMHSIQKHGAYLYLSFGDFDYESGILRWEPTQPLASNQPLTAYADCWQGAQRYRTGDILFPAGDYMYWMADASAGGTTSLERGVWKGRKDMTGTPVRVDSQINQFNRHSGWYGAVLPSGNMIFSEFLEIEATGEPMYFYGTQDGGESWVICGRYGVDSTGRGGAVNMFVWGSLLFYVKTRHSGKVPDTATVVMQEKAWRSEDASPRILHPVYWVGLSGVDDDSASRGHRPSTPWLSLEYAVTGNRVTYGANIRKSPGKFTVVPVAPIWDANSKAPKNVESVFIDGAPGDSTVIYLDGADSLAEMVASPLAVVRGMRLHTGSVAVLTASKAGPAVMAGPAI